jgi:putative PIN family toxin of toxin-antitoxin system
VQASKPAVVLDTNVVLDWLVFRNPEGQPLFQAIQQRQLRWLVTEPMREELFHVLGRGVASAWAPNPPVILESWRKLSETVPTPDLQGAASRLRCTDYDDQKFVDLALSQAKWLVSRDRAVLKLARRAEPLGLRVLPPGRWLPT